MPSLLRLPLRWLPMLVALLALVAPRAARAQTDSFGLGTGRDGSLVVVTPNVVINVYAAVTAGASAGSNSVAVSNGSLFVAGNLVLLWQVQAGSFASGVAGPVALGAGNAGRYELARVASVAGNSLTLSGPLGNSYAAPGAQVVLVREFTSLTVGPTGSIAAPAWDGSVGGVVAAFVNGVVTLTGSIDASATGTRGGAVSVNFCNGSCAAGMDLATTDDPTCQMGGHGESVDTSATAFGSMACGTGNRANGGGGGGHINAGGAGGGNGGAGGHGGDAWSSHGATGGAGGAALSGALASFLTAGGGGGGGQQNNGVSSPGGNGGGVVWLRALTFAGTGNVLARGASVATNGNDGQGGGGAGGSVLLQVVGTLSCGALDVAGGLGGSATGAAVSHGTGGGGGGGRSRVDARGRTGCASVLTGGAAGTGWTGALDGDVGVEDSGGTFGCVTSADCAGASPLCNAVHLCVPCTDPSAPSCPAGTVCLRTGSASGTCVQCGADSDCPASQVCDTTGHACVTPACRGNAGSGSLADCPAATPLCSNPGTVAASCGPCGAGTVFDGAMHRCVAPTVVLTNPPASGSANTTNVRAPLSGTGVPGQLVTVAVNGTTVCTATVTVAGTWTCVPGSDLALGPQTVTALSGGAMSMGTLVVQCTLDAQCAAGQVCNVASGVCSTPSCRGNAGSGSGADCGAALPLCSNPGTVLASCGTCPLGQVFSTAAHSCVAASVVLTNPPAGGMASTTQRRPAITGTGVPGQMVVVLAGGMAVCTATVDATGAWSCTPGTDLPLGPSVLSATSGGATSTGTLIVQCTADAQCATGQLCDTTSGSCSTAACLGNAGQGTSADCTSLAPVCSNPGTLLAACGTCATGQVFDTSAHLCVAASVAFTSPPAGGTATTTNPRAPLSGTGVAGQQVTVSAGGTTVCTAVVAADGTWQCVPGVDLPLGSNPLTALSGGATSTATLVVQCLTNTQCGAGQVCDTGSGSCTTPSCQGNAGSGSMADCTLATPLCTGPGTAAAMCSACAAGQAFDTAMHQCVTAAVALTSPPAGGTASTAMTMPTVRGTGVPGQSVTVTAGGRTLCVAMVQPDGTWSCDSTAPLPVGPNTITATSAGATSMGTLVVQCTASTQCSGATPACDTGSGSCVGCVTDATCGAGRFCDMGPHQCANLLPVGAVCTRPAQCASALCTAGMCAAGDAGAGDAGFDASVDGRAGDGAAGDGSSSGRVAGAGTCACSAAGAGAGSSGSGALALLGAGLALCVARRRRARA